MSEIAAVWFEEAKKLLFEQALFIRCANKKEQTEFANEMKKERDLFEDFDPEHASQIFITKTRKETKFYVVLERKYRAVFTAFLRNKEGKFSKLSIDPQRRRTLTLMLRDKRSREEIEETLNGLTDEEIEEFF